MNGKPDTLILGTDALMREFELETDHAFEGYNLIELMSQIFMALLTDGCTADFYGIPDFNRMKRNPYFDTIENRCKIELATKKLCHSIYRLIDDLRAYDNREFPYMFDKFIGKDIMVCHIPY